MSVGSQIREIIELRNYSFAGLAIVQTFGDQLRRIWYIIYNIYIYLYILGMWFWWMTKWSAALRNNQVTPNKIYIIYMLPWREMG